MLAIVCTLLSVTCSISSLGLHSAFRHLCPLFDDLCPLFGWIAWQLPWQLTKCLEVGRLRDEDIIRLVITAGSLLHDMAAGSFV